MRAEVTFHLTRAYLYNTSVKFTTVCWLLTLTVAVVMAMAMAALVVAVAALMALETGWRVILVMAIAFVDGGEGGDADGPSGLLKWIG